ncbi:DNA repair metallo-beta-lactamase, putative [Entamoeba histolytica HM-1:IMSS-B]|uniref:DNA repair metallo-beta-lactamase domain-containing protein n=6 Tax=Entamoeba histolytica TaxID=5759 RepID=C4M3Y4_ENTH1|nr:hypothetical protein, conserved [Entamoeba histolytica HM-1:IMSS]EMD45008.1 DNA repair metallobeta-lactamase, putative [Entamoeba histolytica KU27]EMH76539.1 DNA repair metallo-beta-lactamase, putative [Entamoeba histolytica HM-1:IMSS-B]EMS12085.1 DNA repair metallo-beta-lactamase [Entamoeba histolytica HM-3:IMSS]ENY62960.1 DNA repair metallo-beta-lactamase, putative [Entamoeba histolytica HM-1:IMSS-A]GAT96051.1 hypothetical protein conserved [Entamoeba histolytica]|eukprot:XP_652680.1 hypothetical protein, conserved [Entamoeba histolytica HM-1:IMSS]
MSLSNTRKISREELHKQYLSDPCKLLFNEFIVDAFKYQIKGYKYFLLSHFHSDHYLGLSSRWKCGIIIGTEITLNLVRYKFKVENEYLYVIPLNTPTYFEGSNNDGYIVTAIEAGHAPGSCCFVIKRISDGIIYLHVGDFRFDSTLQNDKNWKEYVFTQHINTLFLDTTYCDPQYKFKERQIICNEAVKIVKQSMGKTLFIVQTYTIGKEMFVEEIARQTGIKIHVDENKYSIVKLCKRDLSLYTLEESSLEIRTSTSNSSITSLTVELSQLPNKYDRIIIFQPTGWAKKTTCKGSFEVKEYKMPYSEHSSFNELIDCYKMIHADHVIPSVIGEGQTSQKIIEMIERESKPKPGTLDSFFISKKKFNSESIVPHKIKDFHEPLLSNKQVVSSIIID